MISSPLLALCRNNLKLEVSTLSGWCLAKREGISINQFIAPAVAEKMSALMTESYLETRATQGNEKAFLDAMSKVPDVAPEKIDRLF